MKKLLSAILVVLLLTPGSFVIPSLLIAGAVGYLFHAQDSKKNLEPSKQAVADNSELLQTKKHSWKNRFYRSKTYHMLHSYHDMIEKEQAKLVISRKLKKFSRKKHLRI